MKNTKDLLNRLDKVKRATEYESSKRVRVDADSSVRVNISTDTATLEYYKSLLQAKDDQIQALQRSLSDMQAIASAPNMSSEILQHELISSKETIAELERIVEKQYELIERQLTPVIPAATVVHINEPSEEIKKQLEEAAEVVEFYAEKKNIESTWCGVIVKEDGQLARNYRDKYVKKS